MRDALATMTDDSGSRPSSGHRPVPGLPNPTLDSQRTFRCLLDALAHPGEAQRLPVLPMAPAPLSPSAAAICLTLLDADTALWIDPPARTVSEIGRYLAFRCGCPVVDHPPDAHFAVVTKPGPGIDLAAFNAGTLAFPDRSTTIIVQAQQLDNTTGVRLTGPGISGVRTLSVGGVAVDFWTGIRQNHSRFPRGIDLFCVDSTHVVGLPRTAKPEI